MSWIKKKRLVYSSNQYKQYYLGLKSNGAYGLLLFFSLCFFVFHFCKLSVSVHCFTHWDTLIIMFPNLPREIGHLIWLFKVPRGLWHYVLCSYLVIYDAIWLLFRCKCYCNYLSKLHCLWMLTEIDYLFFKAFVCFQCPRNKSLNLFCSYPPYCSHSDLYSFVFECTDHMLCERVSALKPPGRQAYWTPAW